jgi:hypothetical protein
MPLVEILRTQLQALAPCLVLYQALFHDQDHQVDQAALVTLEGVVEAAVAVVGSAHYPQFITMKK